MQLLDGVPVASPDVAGLPVVERRGNKRYCLRLPMQYRITEHRRRERKGTALLRDISSVGLSFQSRLTFPLGCHLNIMIDWPVKHNGANPLQLLLCGLVVRSDGSSTAVAMTSYRFSVLDSGSTAVTPPLGSPDP